MNAIRSVGWLRVCLHFITTPFENWSAMENLITLNCGLKGKWECIGTFVWLSVGNWSMIIAIENSSAITEIVLSRKNTKVDRITFCLYSRSNSLNLKNQKSQRLTPRWSTEYNSLLYLGVIPWLTLLKDQILCYFYDFIRIRANKSKYHNILLWKKSKMN